eukprot:781095_1
MCFKNARDIRERRLTNSRADCAICLQTFKGDAEAGCDIATLDKCGHRFHSECINQWAQIQQSNAGAKSCPLCRAAIRNDSNVPTSNEPRDNRNWCTIIKQHKRIYVYYTIALCLWLANLYYSTLGYQAASYLEYQDCVVSNRQNLQVSQTVDRRWGSTVHIKTINATCDGTNASIQVHDIWYYVAFDPLAYRRVARGSNTRFRAVTVKRDANHTQPSSRAWLSANQPNPGWTHWQPTFHIGKYSFMWIGCIVAVLCHLIIMIPSVHRLLMIPWLSDYSELDDNQFCRYHCCYVLEVLFVWLSFFACASVSNQMQYSMLLDVCSAVNQSILN